MTLFSTFAAENQSENDQNVWRLSDNTCGGSLLFFLRPIFISILHFNKQFFRLMSKLNRLLLLFLLYDAPIRRELKQMTFWRSVRKEVEKDLKMEN